LWATVANVTYGAWNGDRVDIGGIGNLGLAGQNPWVFIKSEPTQGDTLRTDAGSVQIVETTNFLVHTSSNLFSVWAKLWGTPLLQYNENLELENGAAKSVEVDGTEIVVELKDGMTFHNGDPVTASDAVFTYDLIHNINPGTYPYITDMSYDALETVDDLTFRMDLEEPYPPMTTDLMTKIPIFHEEAMREVGAVENPTEVSLTDSVSMWEEGYGVPGNGPFMLEHFEREQFLEFAPFENHALYDVSHRLNLSSYRDTASLSEALIAGEHDIAVGMGPGREDYLNENMDNFQSEGVPSHTTLMAAPQYSHGPTKYTEFRRAMGALIDRQRANTLAMGGMSQPVLKASWAAPSHPMFAWGEDDLYKFTDDPTGDIEKARQILEDAGWGWDDNGNLHYPPGKSGEGRWPAGEKPDPADYECLEGDREAPKVVAPDGTVVSEAP
jgi:peptide/nickel transport system substrate-binding protein